jgi:hypothetical protein
MNNTVNDREINMGIRLENHSHPGDKKSVDWSSISFGLDCITMILVFIYGFVGVAALFSECFLYHWLIVKALLVFSFSGLCFRVFYDEKLRQTNKRKTGYFFINLRFFLSGLLFIMAALHAYAAHDYIRFLQEKVPLLSGASVRSINDYTEFWHGDSERYIVVTMDKDLFLAQIHQSEPVNDDHPVFKSNNYMRFKINPGSYKGFLVSNQYAPYYILYNPDSSSRGKIYIIKPYFG